MTESSHSTPPEAASSKSRDFKPPATKRRVRRNALATKERILEAGRVEFSEHGYNGARIDRIAKRSRANIRMLYHYYGGKEKLYLAVLEDTYRRVREKERELDLEHLEPEDAMRRLIEFTFDYMLEDPTFVKLICNENLLQGKYLKKSRFVPEATFPLLEALRNLLARGQSENVFHKSVDPIQLYVTILSVCFTHVSNRYTLSIMFQRDLSQPRWLRTRRDHVVDVIVSYLTAGL